MTSLQEQMNVELNTIGVSQILFFSWLLWPKLSMVMP